MLNFKSWLEGSLRDIIQPIQQSPKHHAEGDVFVHTRMVRQQLQSAIAYFQQLAVDKDSVFGNLDRQLSPADVNLLRIGAWLHDIGKASATTDDSGKIQAIGHEQPAHFEPMMKKLGSPWQQMYEKASAEDKEDLWFIIQQHMSLQPHFPRKFLRQLLDATGKFKNDRRVKLLLILIMMDQSGRISLGGLNGDAALPEIAGRMRQSAMDFQSTIKPQKEKSSDDPTTFANDLMTKGLDQGTIRKAYFGKFGQNMQ